MYGPNAPAPSTAIVPATRTWVTRSTRLKKPRNPIHSPQKPSATPTRCTSARIALMPIGCPMKSAPNKISTQYTVIQDWAGSAETGANPVPNRGGGR